LQRGVLNLELDMDVNAFNPAAKPRQDMQSPASQQLLPLLAAALRRAQAQIDALTHQ
jgi:hypothetical protein